MRSTRCAARMQRSRSPLRCCCGLRPRPFARRRSIRQPLPPHFHRATPARTSTSSRARHATGSTAAARPAASSASTSICRTSPTAPLRRRSRCGDWFAVIHEGGPVRGLDRHMPAFGDALSARRHRGGHSASLDVLRQPGVAARRSEPAAVVLHREGVSGKRGDLSRPPSPRPERRRSAARSSTKSGSASATSSSWPFQLMCCRTRDAGWSRGLGDVAIAFKRALLRERRQRTHPQRRRRSSSCRPARKAQASATGSPSSSRRRSSARSCRGACSCRRRPASKCRRITAAATTRHSGAPPSAARWRRTAASAAPGRRCWKCWARAKPTDEAEWDVVPQLQVTLSKLQHVMVAGGRAHPGQRTGRTSSPGADLPAVGLVRRQLFRFLEMTRSRFRACVASLWLLALLVAAPRAAQTPAAAAPAVAAHAGALFTTSDNCMACHNNLVTPLGEDVSIGSTWRSSMMANSGRDPYFQAGLRREVDRSPDGRRRASRTNARPATCRCCSGRRMRLAGGPTSSPSFRSARLRAIRAPARQAHWPRMACPAPCAIRFRTRSSGRARRSTAAS